MLDITTELKALKLHGMADAWADLMDQSPSSAENSKLLLEHMLRAEQTERAMRSVRNQLIAAKFPVHRDLARFDFNASKVDKKLVEQLATNLELRLKRSAEVVPKGILQVGHSVELPR